MHCILIYIYSDIHIDINNNLIYSGFVFVTKPSCKLASILLEKELPTPLYILEYKKEGDSSEHREISVKKKLNSVAGTYMCINLINGNIYVGSAGLNRMYARFRNHLYSLTTGSVLVKQAILKYGQVNFAFVVIEVAGDHTRKSVLASEQKYIDKLNPEYNILKIAGSRLDSK